MTTIQAALAVISSVILPFIIQAIKSEAMGGNAARGSPSPLRRSSAPSPQWPTESRPTPARGSPRSSPASAACRWHMRLQAVGVTDKWLDALLAMGTPKKDN